jgi:hypothetical protein
MNASRELYSITILPFGYSGNASLTSCKTKKEYCEKRAKLSLFLTN